MDSKALRRLVECALLIAVGTVLSLFEFKGVWALGGGITFCDMLPLVMISNRHGVRAGVGCALVFSVIQLLLGLNNLQYAPDALTAVGIILLDYVLAYTVIGFSGGFRNLCKNPRTGIVLGIAVTFFARFLCHFVSGVWIWEALWPNAKGWAPVVWSLAYNASYMLPEALITSAVAFFSFQPLKQYWLCQETRKGK